METFIGEALLCCDGRVFESFGSRENGRGRVHLAALDRLEIGTAKRECYLQAHTVWKTTPILVTFPESQRAAAEAFVEHVHQARRTMMG